MAKEKNSKRDVKSALTIIQLSHEFNCHTTIENKEKSQFTGRSAFHRSRSSSIGANPSAFEVFLHKMVRIELIRNKIIRGIDCYARVVCVVCCVTDIFRLDHT